MTIDASDRAAVAHFVRVCGSGVVASIGADGAPQAAYVGLTATDEGVLVFDATSDSRKVGNIRERPRVALAVTGADTSVQLEGRAHVARDEERWRLGEVYSERFPGSRALDVGFEVVVVDVHWVRVYDAGEHPPRVVEAIWE
ncbi:pyridoxamine 5'-phosphate oxidase family protein [Microbacterium esteraromaticum]|uniref:Pyridoxamine 5'-phosphate oxidase family protein n=1 Tax=Microbacterium esteraromaticum TaxID=57043 RepID=A0A7D8AIV3_9MICO|nr:pyridoxamine 5'-phosphate oxidase family protein [Microbacterium esteraromaticum]QMU98502.1 pyridoxamine 5'-phosphate oxidase family protein [Microbacterium esteraromaticum]